MLSRSAQCLNHFEETCGPGECDSCCRNTRLDRAVKRRNLNKLIFPVASAVFINNAAAACAVTINNRPPFEESRYRLRKNNPYAELGIIGIVPRNG